MPGSMAGGVIRLPQLSTRQHPDLTIIPEPERPRRRPHTSDDYRVKVPVEPSGWPCRGCDQGCDMARYHRASLRYPGAPVCSRATVGPALGLHLEPRIKRRPQGVVREVVKARSRVQTAR